MTGNMNTPVAVETAPLAAPIAGPSQGSVRGGT